MREITIFKYLKYSGILRDKTMAHYIDVQYIPNADNQNYSFCRLLSGYDPNYKFVTNQSNLKRVRVTWLYNFGYKRNLQSNVPSLPENHTKFSKKKMNLINNPFYPKNIHLSKTESGS